MCEPAVDIITVELPQAIEEIVHNCFQNYQIDNCSRVDSQWKDGEMHLKAVERSNC